MAIIKCPECGKEISDKAVTCPKCGFPLHQTQIEGVIVNSFDSTEERNINNGIKDTYIWLLSGVLVFAIGLEFFKAPTYAYIPVGILNAVFVILDARRLERTGIKVNRVCIILGILLLYPVYVIARTVKTRKILPGVVYSLLCVVFVLFVYRVFFSKTSKELLEYINNDSRDMAKIEAEMLDSLNSVAGPNYKDDYTMYYEIQNTTLPKAHELLSKANSIYTNISSKDLREVHVIYLDFVGAYIDAFEYVVEGIEQQSVTTVQKGNRKIEQATKLASDYQAALKQLADKCGVELYTK